MFDKIVHEMPRDDVPLKACDSQPRLDTPHSLRQFWNECGSGYYGGLALHVFGVGFEESFHDIEKWNRDALNFYRWLVPERYIAFAEDAFGTQFFFDEAKETSPVYSLVVQDALMFTVAESIDAFFDDLLDETKRDGILNYSFYIECLTNGIDHQPGHHVTLKVPRCLGGNEAMGLIDVDAVTNVAYLGQLLEQAQNLAPAELASRIRYYRE